MLSMKLINKKVKFLLIRTASEEQSMSCTIFMLLCVCMTGLYLTTEEGREPPRKFTLEINGETHAVALDQPFKLEGVFENPELVLKASPTRLFPYGGVEFLYPAYFTWEADLEEGGIKTWTLSGNDFKIMYFVSPVSLSQEVYAAAMVEQFGREKVRTAEKERTLDGRVLKGKFLTIDLAGVFLIMEIYQLPSLSGSRLLVLQDSPPEDRACSEESEETLELLKSSFKDKLAPGEAD